jgi:hypothetical protein
MSLFSRLARSKDAAPAPEQAAECGHREMAPRWDSVADMGKKDKVSSFACTSCQESFTPEEARQITAALV